MRGKHKPAHAMDHTATDDHMESYNPTISYYLREHAPRRRYLPPELSVEEMAANYNHLNPLCTIHYTTYLRRLHENISFTKLETEECEVCNELEMVHMIKNGEKCLPDCSTCQAKLTHETLVVRARMAYKMAFARRIQLQEVEAYKKLLCYQGYQD